MRALILGVTGQDGSYLADFLLHKGYEVYGTSRDAQVSSFANLKYLGISNRVKTLSTVPNDFRSILKALNESKPDEIYYLAGQSSVGLSFEQPAETLESIILGTLNLLEAVRFLGRQTKIYLAGSSECFGDVNDGSATESTSFSPRSPYAVAKASAHWLVANYREAYGLFACNGILFNHESPLRQKRFVTQKIVTAACQIARGSKEKLHLGRLDIVRDWGWAPEYVEAMWMMLQQVKPTDFIIATGQGHSLEQFVDAAFSELGMNWQDYVVSDNALYRPTDLARSVGNPQLAAEKLGWKAKSNMHDIVRNMVAEEMKTRT